MTKRPMAFRQSRCPQRTCLCEVMGQVGALLGMLATKMEVSLDRGLVWVPDQLEDQQEDQSLCDATFQYVVGAQNKRLRLALIAKLCHRRRNACLVAAHRDLRPVSGMASKGPLNLPLDLRLWQKGGWEIQLDRMPYQ